MDLAAQYEEGGVGRREGYYIEVHGEGGSKEGGLNFFSPPVLMHGGLLGIAFCLSVCRSVCPSGTNTRSRSLLM